jgi:hypothetical protein
MMLHVSDDFMSDGTELTATVFFSTTCQSCSIPV